MRKFALQLYSNIHLESFNNYPLIKPKANTLFLAGNIGHYNQNNFKEFFDYCSPRWKTIVYVLGNREFNINDNNINDNNIDNNNIDNKYNKYKKFFNNYNNIYLLNNSFVRIDDINIYGSTLWPRSTVDFVSNKEYFNDYNENKYMDIQNTSNLQYNSLKNYIENNKKKTIIISHFSPIQSNTLSLQYVNQDKFIKDYFAHENLIDDINNKNIISWISGHSQYSYDFNYKNIRLLSNHNEYNKDDLFELII